MKFLFKPTNGKVGIESNSEENGPHFLETKKPRESEVLGVIGTTFLLVFKDS
ncbi:hypothetical protein Ataiwa_08300 [Algoriphagus taiwanensis]|uniref:Uncharacterized protein n=1 Tax=Algoriphagus taiwanensis TaxID=1445656 RepID=A0ABQ6PZC2_9BACT|nr:hypothetical protein Ataiwa_08300 [Algoriphagus taiwanensis]